MLVWDEGVTQPVVVVDGHGVVDEEVDELALQDDILLGLQHRDVVRGGWLAAGLDLLHLDVKGLGAKPGEKVLAYVSHATSRTCLPVGAEDLQLPVGLVEGLKVDDIVLPVLHDHPPHLTKWLEWQL